MTFYSDHFRTRKGFIKVVKTPKIRPKILMQQFVQS